MILLLLLLFIDLGNGNPYRRCSYHENESSSPIVAIAFFGLSRSLRFTLPSIEKHVFNVLAKNSIRFDVFSYTTNVPSLNMTRDNVSETGLVDPFDIQLLRPCRFSLVDQSSIVDHEFIKFMEARTKKKKKRLDIFKDNFRSVRNILCSFYTQTGVLDLINHYGTENNVHYDAILAIRPDTAVMRDIDLPSHIQSIKENPSALWIPDFAHWHGYNDRAAFGSVNAMTLYLERGAEFRDSDWRKNGETFLLHYMRRKGLEFHPSSIRVIRIRIDGSVFSGPAGDLIPEMMNVSQDDADFNRCLDLKKGLYKPSLC